MAGNLSPLRCFLAPVLLVSIASAAEAQLPAPAQAQAMVERALANDLHSAQDKTHPMRYRLRKSSSRFASTKEILETKEGAVARLVSVNDKPLNAADEQKEQARLDLLFNDPSRQRHRKQNEEADTERALKVLRALPKAFLYQFTGSGNASGIRVEKFAFRPNPAFTPPDLETQVLTQMSGELWVDPTAEHVVRLEGHLLQDVDFGWGILGRLDKGGWISIDQAEIGPHQWRIVRFQMVMSGRVLFKTKSFDTIEEESDFAAVPPGINYRQAIQMLRAAPARMPHP